MTSMNKTKRSIAALCAALSGGPALAVDLSWSGFATLGYAKSDSPYTYQRFIDDDGTFERDSLLAGQLDLRFTPRWSATLQAKLAPSARSDSRWDATPAWAFVAWRPNDDWLLRAGRMRVPLYLHSESLDIGVSHDMARLPHEMYSLAPTNDFNGVYASRNAALGERELSIDLYGGSTSTRPRQWSRDGLPPLLAPGASFRNIDIDAVGLVLTARDARSTLRLGLHTTQSRNGDGPPTPVRFPRVDLGPGLGYWQVDNALPGPGVPTTNRFRNDVVTGGGELQLGGGWRIAGEFVRMRQRDTELGSDSVAGYAALFKRIGDFTPYVSAARQLSSRELRDWHARLITPALPGFVPGAAQINAAQRAAAEGLYVFDQHSLALGSSYALSPTAKIKAEWMRTKVGSVSNHFDTPPGLPDLRDAKVDTLTFNISIAF